MPNFKCKRNLRNIIGYETNFGRLIDPQNSLSDDYDTNSNNNSVELPFITYRDVGMQTESPNMVDKAIQVSLPRSRRKPSITRRSPNYIDSGHRSSPNNNQSVTINDNNNNNSHGLMPNILYNGVDGNSNIIMNYESPQLRSTLKAAGNEDLMEESEDDSMIYQSYNKEITKGMKVGKRKNKSPIETSINNKITKQQQKQQIEDESYQDNDSNDLRLGLISEIDDDDEHPLNIMDGEQAFAIMDVGGQSSDAVNEVGLEVDDMFIFTHHPTGLSYQIFNGKRSINKEMMEKVFSSVIGKQDKFYICLYPPHGGSCHNSAGKSTKIRVIKNHLTSHLFLYRCRLCGRTYKYYNNLFNHFNKHPQ